MFGNGAMTKTMGRILDKFEVNNIRWDARRAGLSDHYGHAAEHVRVVTDSFREDAEVWVRTLRPTSQNYRLITNGWGQATRLIWSNHMCTAMDKSLLTYSGMHRVTWASIQTASNCCSVPLLKPPKHAESSEDQTHDSV